MAATNEAVYTETEVETMMDDTVGLNPTNSEVDHEVNITLVYGAGVTFNAGTLFNALQALGTIQSDKVPTRGNYNFIITEAP